MSYYAVFGIIGAQDFYEPLQKLESVSSYQKMQKDDSVKAKQSHPQFFNR